MKSTAPQHVFEEILQKFKHSLGHNDTLFLQRIYKEGLKKYQDRLDAINFSGYQDVLDAGCGYGQWALALAMSNQNVSACDISKQRIAFLAEISRSLNIENLQPLVGNLDMLPYNNTSFDAVFCYGALFLTPWKQTLKEFSRVLKPGGTLYVNANGVGWYMFLWLEEHNKADDYDPKAVAAQAFSNTLRYERKGQHESGNNLIIEPNLLKETLTKLGFQYIHIADEGCLHLNPTALPPTPFFKGEYSEQTASYEVIAHTPMT